MSYVIIFANIITGTSMKPSVLIQTSILIMSNCTRKIGMCYRMIRMFQLYSLYVLMIVITNKLSVI